MKTELPCPRDDCGLLHDENGYHAERGWARGARRALYHHPGECSAYGDLGHHAADCPLLTPEEKDAIRWAAEAAIERDSPPSS